MDEQGDLCCSHQHDSHKKEWYKNPLLLIYLGALVLLILSFPFPLLSDFRRAFFDYAKMMFWPVALGFLIGGLVDYYVPHEYISKYLARKGKRTVLYAVGLGFFASACSHGVIALSMELHKKGASGPAVISFLLASPWASLPITFILIGFFGVKAFLIISGALAVALNTGLILQILDQKNWIERNRNTVAIPAEFSIRKDILRRFGQYSFSLESLRQDALGVAKGAFELAKMVFHWILLGMVLASLAGAFVPENIFHRFFGPTFPGLLLTLGLATILEVCSEGTSPLAFEIYRQTGAFGNAFAFLMGGVITDFTEVALVWANLGKKTALWMLAVTLPQVLLLSWVFNLLF